jgi:pimeloyl-ACP methyl ester carboxylesterase
MKALTNSLAGTWALVRLIIVWAKEDRVMPPEHGRRLAELFPQGRLVEIPDSYTLIPEDQPGKLAHAIREFVRDTP